MHQNTNKSQISILNDQNIPKSYITAIPFHGATFCDTIGKTITGFIGICLRFVFWCPGSFLKNESLRIN